MIKYKHGMLDLADIKFQLKLIKINKFKTILDF